MQDDTLDYCELKKEYENYQVSSEMQMQRLSKKIMKLEKDMDILANIVEISKYINTFISDENLISMINDMILGLLGVSYSTIFLNEDEETKVEEMKVKVTNIKDGKLKLTDDEKAYIDAGKSYILNNKAGIRYYEDSDLNICSIMGMPIKLRKKYFGFILVEHKNNDFLGEEHYTFLRAIANQIAIGLENSMLYRKINETAKRDPLLGIYNRRYFFQHVHDKLKGGSSKEYAIVMMDLDNFKKCNDVYGHQYGDKVLIETVRVIKDKLTEKDILARYGGEEIIIYIDDFDSKEDVLKRVEEIRQSIEDNIIEDEQVSRNITSSIGLAFSNTDISSINNVINEADSLLYEAKSNGKNRVLHNIS